MNDLRFYTVAEVAGMLSVTPATVRRYIDVGLHGRKLRAHRIAGGSGIRIERADIRDFIGMEPPREIRPAHTIEDAVRNLERCGIIRPRRERRAS